MNLKDKQIIQQLVSFQNDTKQQLKDIQDAQAYNTYGLHATGLALTKMLKSNNRQGFYNQSLPPPTNLGNLYSGTYYRQYEVDTSDREGVIATNDPMENISIQDISFIDNPLNEQTELAPPPEDQEVQTDYATDIQDNVGLKITFGDTSKEYYTFAASNLNASVLGGVLIQEDGTPITVLTDGGTIIPGINTSSPSQIASTSISLPNKYLSIKTGFFLSFKNAFFK